MTDRCENCIHVQMCKWTDEMVANHTCDWYEKERPHGEWIIRRDKRGKHIYSVCSRCNVAHLDTDFPNFCPNCGADMREGDERSE